MCVCGVHLLSYSNVDHFDIGCDVANRFVHARGLPLFYYYYYLLFVIVVRLCAFIERHLLPRSRLESLFKHEHVRGVRV